MGQKVSPVGLRVGINKDWESVWYANNKDFSKYLNNDVKIRKFLFKKYKSAGISQIIIERNSKRTEVFIYSSRPGLIIGQSGTEIEKVKKDTEIVDFSKGILTYVDVDFLEYRRKVDTKTVRRNVALPSWLNYEADQAGVNVSRILQEALMSTLKLERRM